MKIANEIIKIAEEGYLSEKAQNAIMDSCADCPIIREKKIEIHYLNQQSKRIRIIYFPKTI